MAQTAVALQELLEIFNENFIIQTLVRIGTFRGNTLNSQEWWRILRK
jgi:hypothetical protein